MRCEAASGRPPCRGGQQRDRAPATSGCTAQPLLLIHQVERWRHNEWPPTEPLTARRPGPSELHSDGQWGGCCARRVAAAALPSSAQRRRCCACPPCCPRLQLRRLPGVAPCKGCSIVSNECLHVARCDQQTVYHAPPPTQSASQSAHQRQQRAAAGAAEEPSQQPHRLPCLLATAASRLVHTASAAATDEARALVLLCSSPLPAASLPAPTRSMTRLTFAALLACVTAVSCFTLVSSQSANPCTFSSLQAKGLTSNLIVRRTHRTAHRARPHRNVLGRASLSSVSSLLRRPTSLRRGLTPTFCTPAVSRQRELNAGIAVTRCNCSSLCPALLCPAQAW